jgi:hypothetical protein
MASIKNQIKKSENGSLTAPPKENERQLDATMNSKIQNKRKRSLMALFLSVALLGLLVQQQPTLWSDMHRVWRMANLAFPEAALDGMESGSW